MGTVVRRASSLVAPRSSSSDRDDTVSTKSSIKGINTSPAITQDPQATKPSPIAESPAREAASSQGDFIPPVVQSPLAQDPVVASPIETLTSDQPAAEAVPTSPQGYVPPPLLDSSAVGPGGFTDEPDELPQPQVIVDPSLAQPESTPEDAPVPQVLADEVLTENAVVVESPVEEAFAERPFEATAPEPQAEVVSETLVDTAVTQEASGEVTVEERAVEERTVEERAVEVPVAQDVVPPRPATPVGEAASYFNLPVQGGETVGVPQAVEAHTEAFRTVAETGYPGGATEVPIPEEQTRGYDSVEAITSPPRAIPTPPPERTAPPASVYPIPVYDVHEVWRDPSRMDGEEQKSTIPSMNGDASSRSVSSIQ